jgi:hypothetical protein
VLVDLEEALLVHDQVDHLLDVVRLVGRARHDAVEGLLPPARRIVRLRARRVLEVVRGDVRKQLLDRREAGPVVVGREVRHAGNRLCVIAPPRFSFVTSSWVTVLMTSGPVMNM